MHDLSSVRGCVQLANADMRGARGVPSNKDLEAAAKAAHAFWETQPVTQFSAERSAPELPEGPIQPPQKMEDVRQEPYKLPSAYEWCTCDVNDAQVRARGVDWKDVLVPGNFTRSGPRFSIRAFYFLSCAFWFCLEAPQDSSCWRQNFHSFEQSMFVKNFPIPSRDVKHQCFGVVAPGAPGGPLMTLNPGYI